MGALQNATAEAIAKLNDGNTTANPNPPRRHTQAITTNTDPITGASFTITFGTLTFTINNDTEGIYTGNQTSKNQKATPSKTIPQSTDKPNYHPATATHQAAINKRKTNRSHASNQSQNQSYSKGKYYDEHIKTAPVHRFIKPPPATEHWQRAVKKKKQNKRQNNQNRKCYFCGKYGHIQRFCWQRLKCHKCGRAGHKWANCLFKLPHNTDTNLPKQRDKSHQRTKQRPPNSGMEYIHGRPPSETYTAPLE